MRSANQSTTISVPTLRANVPWYFVEYGTSAGYAFTLIATRAMFPTNESASASLASSYPGAAREVVILAPALLLGLTTWVLALSAAPRCPSLGHPLVAIGLWISGRLRFRGFVLAISVQILGAAAGAFFARAFFLEETILRDPPLLSYSPTFQLGQAALFEMIAGFFLVWALFSMASFEPSNAQWQNALPTGFVLGLVTVVLAIGGRYLTGGIANPAAAMGSVMATYVPIDYVVYVIAPIFGGITATLLGGGPRKSIGHSSLT